MIYGRDEKEARRGVLQEKRNKAPQYRRAVGQAPFADGHSSPLIDIYVIGADRGGL